MKKNKFIEPFQAITSADKPEVLLNKTEQACAAGLRWLQLRMKQYGPDEIESTAVDIKKICDQYGCRLIINDYPLIALRTGAAGVHLGSSDMDPREARRLCGTEMIIGCTANTFEQVCKVKDYADYIGIGPYRYTATKENLNPILGAAGIKAIVTQCRKANIPVPLIAIGGITVSDIRELLASGVNGIAVCGDVFNSTDIAASVQSFLLFLNLKK